MAARAKWVLETNCPPQKSPFRVSRRFWYVHTVLNVLRNGSDNLPRTRFSFSLFPINGTGGYYHAQRTAPTSEPVSGGRFFERRINARRLPSSPPTHPRPQRCFAILHSITGTAGYYRDRRTTPARVLRTRNRYPPDIIMLSIQIRTDGSSSSCI